MSLYCSFGMFGVDPEDYPAPLVYQGSHVMPTTDSPRGGSVDLGYLPGFITHEGRDRAGTPGDQAGDEGVWPWLRLSVAPVQPPAVQRRLDRKAWRYGLVLRAHRVLRLRRLGVGYPGGWAWPADTVILDRDQVVALRDALTDWLHRCDDPDGWLDARMGQGGGAG